MADRRTYLRPQPFHGNFKEDGELWLETFEGKATANGENTDADKMRLIRGLMEGEAQRWFTKLPEESTATWEAFKEAFLARYKEEGATASILAKLQR